MSSRKVMEASELRAEAARRQVSRKELADAAGISYDYAWKILQGRRDAPLQRAKMTKYLMNYKGGYDEAV